MSYATTYNIDVIGDITSEAIKKREKLIKEAEKLAPELKEIVLAGIEASIKLPNVHEIIKKHLGYDPFVKSCKWYNHEVDMRIISKEYPDVVFELHGEGEQAGDMWIKYFKNGLCQVANAIISFDKYDATKLR
jgi:hypothetical protein